MFPLSILQMANSTTYSWGDWICEVQLFLGKICAQIGRSLCTFSENA
jgi:hypothetical protein